MAFVTSLYDFYRGTEKPLSLRELVTTVTELKAIAAAARMGLRNPNSPRTGCKNVGTVPPEKKR
jgi:hypothetical protein